MRSAGRPRLFLVALLVAGVLLAPAGASGQSREELEQVRRELAAKYAAAEAELAKLVAELPEVTDDEAGLEQKRAYVDRIFALRGDLEILKSDLEFLDFRLGETTPAAGAGALEGTVYVLSEVLDEEGRPLQQGGWARRLGDYHLESTAIDVPSEFTLGRPVTFSASKLLSRNCRRAREVSGMSLEPDPYFSGTSRDRQGNSLGITATDAEGRGSFGGVRQLAGHPAFSWNSYTEGECAWDRERGEFIGADTVTIRSSVSVTWIPDAIAGSHHYRYTVQHDADRGSNEVRMDPTTGRIIMRAGGIQLVYVTDPEAEPTNLRPYSHPPPLAGDDAGAEETLASSDREGATTPAADRSRFIDEWLAVAEPPQNATEGADLRYDPWGRVEGTTRTGTITLSGPPQTALGSSHEHVWAHRHRLDSVDHCTLGEFVEARLAGDSITGCRGRHRRTAVPDVVGLRVGEAAARLRDAGFTPGATAGGTASSPELAGTVASVGEPRGDRVELVVYTEAVPDVAVPDLSRMPLGRAAERLSAEGLSMAPELGDAAPSSELAGRIYHQEPASATRVADGSSVRVRVYGDFVPPTVPVPDVDGLDLRAAKSRLAAAGLSMAPALGEPAPRRPLASRIYRQDPAAGSPLAPGEPVRVQVYDAFVPPTAAVPDVDGLGLREAGSRLEAAGFAMVPALGEPAPRAASEDRVYRQEPAAGEAMDKGESVRVWVHSGVAAAASREEPVATASGPSAPRPIEEILVPARIGRFVLNFVDFRDTSDWGYSLSQRFDGFKLHSERFSRQGDSYRIPKPGDRWPLYVKWLGCAQYSPYCFDFPIRLEIEYVKVGPYDGGMGAYDASGERRTKGPTFFLEWLSPGLFRRLAEYSDFAGLRDVEAIASQWQSCLSESLGESWSEGTGRMGVHVSSPGKAASVLVDISPDQAGMQSEFEAVARRLLEHIEKGAVECTR